MPYITGTGCAATTIIGAFNAVDEDPLRATATALAYFGLAGERAGAASDGPGSFMVSFIDELYRITPEELEAGCKISVTA